MNVLASEILKFKKPVLSLCFALVIGLTLISCETTAYYSQAAAGQWQVISQGQDIKRLINKENTPEDLKAKLNTILEIRQFAEQTLHLPVDKNYSSYVDLERPFVVWNVFASPEFSVQPTNWCYPIAGCVSYRGYFSEQKAKAYAQKLSEQGQDVYVGGVAAYSTLGWFNDPVLNTILQRDDHQLAALLFHELSHQLLYIAGDTDFNESFATAVEQEGLRLWLQHKQINQQQSQDIINAALQDRQRRTDFVALVNQTLQTLNSLYQEPISEEQMRAAKAVELSLLKERYQQLKQSWSGYNGYDGWFAQDLNNAQLSTVATYYKWVPAFQKILQQSGGLQAFYSKVKALESLTESERQTALEALMN